MEKKPILVVDDEKNIRLTMSHSLESLEIPIKTAVNGEEALEKLGEESFGLVFLDLKMPGMDGMEVLRRIKDDWPGTRVVIITAHGTIESAVEAMKLGAVDFIQKPFSPVEIRETATQVLAREALDEASAVDYGSLIELAKRQISDRGFRAARETVRKAISTDPSQPEAYNLLGALLEIKGDWLEAQKFYRAAIDIDPTFRPARENLNRTTTWYKFGKIDLGSDERKKSPRATTAKRNGMENNLYIVIVGCGRVGSYLADRLSRLGNSVVAIDLHETAFDHLSPDFSGFRIVGDAARMAVLKEAKLKDADFLIATTHDDNVNLMAAQVAREIFGVPRVLARVFDPRREEVYARLGIDTICPTSVAADMFLRAVLNGSSRREGEPQ